MLNRDSDFDYKCYLCNPNYFALYLLFIMATNIFRGLGIALITPFTPDGEVDRKSLKRLVEYQLQNGADFLCILATTGETPCLSAEEKLR